MSHDLVKRLRQLGDKTGLMFVDYDTTIEAADRIEKLEVGDKEWQRICDSYANENQRFSDRIEKLEAALDDVAGHLARADWYYLKPETRKTLDAK
ncbi:hypothetical protein UFOVP165_36 [uncultured Caudovirales phage]|uniref:Uncharacterized protein n=1 Tax=uncultured Caudovirales phage TaxID=2100421 RepID=A0A6J7WFG5_9CAUD|nr:hypothetical protein UFOVP72_23 [uncultured Caudovirales phage]CAB5187363.1 hypothetical protein UFOVP165_36 [uncultured Caudovirales phage]